MKNLIIFLICCFLIFYYPAIYADTLLRVPSSFQSQYQSQGRNNAKNADPPPEVVEILQRAGLTFPEIESMLWLSYPYKAPQDKPIGSEQLIEVDALELLEPLLDTPELFGTVDFIDLFNGCNTHCDTCLLDSQYPTRMFSHGSLDALFKDERLVRMLFATAFRFGLAGDPLDHPQAVKIIKHILKETEVLHRKVKEHLSYVYPPYFKFLAHQVIVFTNYRSHKDGALVELIELAQQNKDRMRVVISLPLQRNDSVQKQFARFVQDHPHLFGKPDKQHISSLGTLVNTDFIERKLGNVSVSDVRRSTVLMTGRILASRFLKGRVEKHRRIVNEDEAEMMQKRGTIRGILLNPDGLWLWLNATLYESHTGFVFTPITSENIGLLSQIPHFYMQNEYALELPNWHGPMAHLSKVNINRRIQEALQSGKPKKKPSEIIERINRRGL